MLCRHSLLQKNMVHLGALNNAFLSSALCGKQMLWWSLLLGTPMCLGISSLCLNLQGQWLGGQTWANWTPSTSLISSWNELLTWHSHPMVKGGDTSEQESTRLWIDPSKRKGFSLHLICTLITKTIHTWIKSIVSCSIFIDIKQF